MRKSETMSRPRRLKVAETGCGSTEPALNRLEATGPYGQAYGTL